MPSQSVETTHADYDAVAELYDRAFRDIRVRRDEWNWVQQRLSSQPDRAQHPRVLDIGCGNGSLLIALQDRMRSGVGVDASSRTIGLAEHNARAYPHLSFHTLATKTLPFEANSFDVVISFLSFRYLDWETTLNEVQRVLSPHGRLLIVDMVKQPVARTDAFLLARSTVRHLVRPLLDRQFHKNVAELTAHPAWQRMLQRNPIRSEQEYRACFNRWFPGRRIEALNTTWTKRLIAIDSGPFQSR
jgi:ubiquinone/menaquinone biosynthesis C-methylase UbiE